MKKTFGIIAGIFSLIIIAGLFFGYQFYKKYYANNVEKEGYILIPHSANFNSIIDSIAPYVKNKEQCVEVAKSKNLDQFFNAGRYRIKSGSNNTDLVNMIKAGNQTENTFRIGDFFTVYQMVGKVAKKTELDSLRFANDLNKIATDKGLIDAEELK